MSYLDRYMNGEQETVWAELVGLGASVQDDKVFPDALAVTTEIVRRSRHNLEILGARLRDLDYRFMNPAPIALSPTNPELITGFEHDGTLLPVAYRVWHERIGTVDFGGSHPRLADSESFVAGFYEDNPPPSTYNPYTFDEAAWKRGAICYLPSSQPMAINEFEVATGLALDQAILGDSPLEIERGPDLTSWAGDDTGCPITLEYDGFCLDGKVADPDHDPEGEWDTTFVGYLRRCFEWGGFPGFFWLSKTDWPFPVGTPPMNLIASLTEGLLPV